MTPLRRVSALLAAGLLGTACSAASTDLQAGSPRRSGSSATTLYGFAGARLYALDARTLRPRRDRGARVNGHLFGWSFSPGRTRLAAGTDGSAELRLYDLRRLRALGDVKLARKGLVYVSTWAGPSRVLAVVISPGCCGLGDTIVAGVDADSRRVVWRRDLEGSLQAGAPNGRGFVLVLGPKWAIGPSRLVTVSPAGRLRVARLEQIRSGWRRRGHRDIVEQSNPGLALDPSGHRAFVVQADAPVAVVDLLRLSVRYHRPAEPISLLGRVRDWLEPAAAAKATQDPIARPSGSATAVWPSPAWTTRRRSTAAATSRSGTSRLA